MPTQCRVCEKQRKRGTKFWQVLDVVCVDDNGDPHVNKGRGKKFGDIFPAADSGVAASAQRRRRGSDHLRKCLISNETTELA